MFGSSKQLVPVMATAVGTGNEIQVPKHQKGPSSSPTLVLFSKPRTLFSVYVNSSFCDIVLSH